MELLTPDNGFVISNNPPSGERSNLAYLIDGIKTSENATDWGATVTSRGVDLGTLKLIEEIIVYPFIYFGSEPTWYGSSNDSLEVWYSVDGSVWNLAETFDGPTPTTDSQPGMYIFYHIHLLLASPITARFICVRAKEDLKGSSGHNVQVPQEIEVYGSEAPSGPGFVPRIIIMG